jgi:hypothetical protein
MAVKDSCAKPLDHLRKSWATRLNDDPGCHVCVDDRNAEIGKSLRHGALAAADAPGEADAQAAGHG